MRNNIIFGSIFICLIIILNACNSSFTHKIDNNLLLNTAENQTAKIKNGDCVFETLSPADIIRDLTKISGNTPKSEPFSLDTDTIIRVHWNQMSKNSFLLYTINVDSKLSDKPERKIEFESSVGPSFGCADATLSAGEYQINIENSDGSWDVLVQVVRYKK